MRKYWNYLLYEVRFIERKEKQVSTWVDDDEEESYFDKSGYYAIKRWWVWIFLFPFIVIMKQFVSLYDNIIESVREIITYRCSWIGSKTKRDLSFKEKLDYLQKILS